MYKDDNNMYKDNKINYKANSFRVIKRFSYNGASIVKTLRTLELEIFTS